MRVQTLIRGWSMVEDNFDKEFNCNHKDLDAASFERITNSFREGRKTLDCFMTSTGTPSEPPLQCTEEL